MSLVEAKALLFFFGGDSPFAGRVGTMHRSQRWLPGVPPPDPGLLSPRRESNQRDAQEGDTFDCVPLLRTTPRNDIFKGAPPPRQRGYPPVQPCCLVAPQRHGTAPPRRRVSWGRSPPFPQICKGANPYLYKKPLAPGARIKLAMTRTDYRVVIAMSVPHP